MRAPAARCRAGWPWLAGALGEGGRLPGEDASVAGAILGLRVEDASRYGTVACDPEGWLVSFQEKRPGAGIINAGVYLLRASAVAEFPKQFPLSFEREVFPALYMGRKRLKVCVTQAPFLDIGTPETLPQAAEFLKQHQQTFSKFMIISRAPVRISFFGGGTDYPEYFHEHERGGSRHGD